MYATSTRGGMSDSQVSCFFFGPLNGFGSGCSGVFFGFHSPKCFSTAAKTCSACARIALTPGRSRPTT